MLRVGRNDPCPCGSGKKYKRCCMPLDIAEAERARVAQPSIPIMVRAALEHYRAG